MSIAEKTDASQFLTFRLAEDIFAIDVIMAKEVLDFADVTKVPQTPDYMLGVINLRGSVVPVVDMRLKFGMPEAEVSETTCMIVVEALKEGETKQVGIIVDSVSEVHDIPQSVMEPAPEFGGSVDRSLMMGMAKLEGKIVILLDIDSVLFDPSDSAAAESVELVDAVS